MGDRANVYIKEDSSRGVYLYTHWAGSELASTVQSALERGKGRWSDGPYLARIIFCEMVKGEPMELTSYGISSYLSDNEHPIIVVDPDTQTIGFAPEPKNGEAPTPDQSWPFQTYIALESNALEVAWSK